MRGSCRGATEGANWTSAEQAPSGPLGHLPRIAGEDLELYNHSLSASVPSPQNPGFGGVIRPRSTRKPPG